MLFEMKTLWFKTGNEKNDVKKRQKYTSIKFEQREIDFRIISLLSLMSRANGFKVIFLMRLHIIIFYVYEIVPP